MKKKINYKLEIEKDRPFYDIKEDEMGEEVKFNIDEGSFRGPFNCHRKKTVLVDKKVSLNDFDFTYNVWQCKKCKKEFVDFQQAARYEKFLVMQRLISDQLIVMERTLNYDGKAYFFRFPKEMSSNFHKGDTVDIKLLTPSGTRLLIEVKGRQ